MRDRFGLTLTTAAPAAELYNSALDRLLSLQGGAETLLQQALDLDPGFALAHAAMAVLGAEFGLAVDVNARLTAAVTAAPKATDRERSFVAAVAFRTHGSARVAARHLLTHIDRFPQDALAVTLAVPTIAFASALELPEQTWDLVESLRPVYGTDWWFSGLLAFIRQEQGRYVEAHDLAMAALGVRPNSGHAAHAMAHVSYETGDHRAGLDWIDGWIGESARSAVNALVYALIGAGRFAAAEQILLVRLGRRSSGRDRAQLRGLRGSVEHAVCVD